MYLDNAYVAAAAAASLPPIVTNYVTLYRLTRDQSSASLVSSAQRYRGRILMVQTDALTKQEQQLL